MCSSDLLVNCTCFLYAGVSLGVVSFLVLFLRERMGYDLELAGRLLAVTQLSGVAGRVLWNVMSDTVFGRRRKPPLVCIGALAGASAYALSFMGPTTPIGLLIAALMLLGFTIVGWNGVTMLFVAELAGRRAASTAAGLNLSFSFVGIGMMAAILPLLYVERGSQMTFVIQSCLLLVSGVYYPTEVLPGWMQVVSAISPATYVLKGVREIGRAHV